VAELSPERVLREFELPGAVRLFVYPTEKFKTSFVNIIFSRPLDDRTSAAALLPYVLRRGTRSHQNMSSIARHLEGLFGASLDVDVLSFGEQQLLSFRLDLVEERYLFMGGRDLLGKGLDLVRELLREPRLEGDCFPASTFEQERENLRRFVEGMFDEKGRYAFDRCVRHMCAGEAYARYEYGELDEIEALTPRALTDVWRSTLRTAPIDVFVVGSAPPEQVRDLVEAAFGDLRDGRDVLDPLPAVRRGAGKLKRVREDDDVAQARLVMGFRTDVAPGDPLSIPLVVGNSVFGAGASSRLFRHVREKHSLAYYCSSSVDQEKGVAFVQAGVDAKQAERVERIVRRQMGDLGRNGPTIEELKAAKAHLKAGVLSITDSAPRTAAFFLERRSSGTVIGIGELLDRISRVRRGDVARAVATMRPDTYYLLARGKG